MLEMVKDAGAFSHSCVPSVHPYILMNFTGKIRDVTTLAHELGHGIHQYLSRKMDIFNKIRLLQLQKPQVYLQKCWFLINYYLN